MVSTHGNSAVVYIVHVFAHTSIIIVAVVLPFDPDSWVSMRALYFIERNGIPVLTELSTKTEEFQALIQVRQPDLPSTIIKWLASPLFSHIKPTWKNLLLVFGILNLDHLAKQVENFVMKKSSERECFSDLLQVPMS